MLSFGKATFAVCFAASVAGLLMWLNASGGATEDRTAEPARQAPPAAQEKPAAKQDTQPKAEKPAKVISLAEAVTIAEKIGKGEATKAERRDKPEFCFKIDVLSPEGKIKVELNADGTLKSSGPEEPKGPGKKKPEDKKPEEKKPEEKKPEEKQ